MKMVKLMGFSTPVAYNFSVPANESHRLDIRDIARELAKFIVEEGMIHSTTRRSYFEDMIDHTFVIYVHKKVMDLP